MELTSSRNAPVDQPRLAGPIPPPRLPGPLKFVRALQTSFISVWPADAYARDLTRVRIGFRDMIVVNAPALVKHVLLDNAANYQKTPIVRRLFAPALGQGLVTAEGAVWARHRHLMAPMFAQRRITALVPQMAAVTQAHLDEWQTNREFDLSAALSHLTLEIITQTMFGAENRAEVAVIAAESGLYQRTLRPSLLDFLGAPAWVRRPGTRRALAIGARLTEVIHRVIARRRTAPDAREDLLALLLRAADAGDMTQREIRDEIATVFTAGHETTAASLEWILYLLDRHPAVETRVMDELSRELGGRSPVAEDLERLRFTRQVAEEALRLYPPAHSMTRMALGPDRLGDLAVPRGAVLVVSPWILHRNPNVWREPGRFDPDRFDTRDQAQQRVRYSYIPFGAGPRICIGASFAMSEILVVLATLLQRWRVRLASDQAIEPVALITMRPKSHLRAMVEKPALREALGMAAIRT
jgi:cytochrome P450